MLNPVVRLVCLSLILAWGAAAEWHIALTGSDEASGGKAAPLRTPAAADARARPGDTIIVHGGVWRERFAPTTGGEPDLPITWRAADDAEVILSASEPATDWQDLGDGRWRLDLDVFDFRDWNPYGERMKKGPLKGAGRNRSLGMVWLDGEPLQEVDAPRAVDAPRTWAPTLEADAIVAHFGELDPAAQRIEISVREQCFSPSVWNLGHIVVEGFIIEHAANDYDDFFGKPEAAPQHGALSTFGGHDWVIRGNTVRDCVAIGIDFGLQGRAAMDAHGGRPKRFGHHRLIGNRVERCGAAGMIAYKGPYCVVRDNVFIGNGWQDVGGHGKAALKLISSCIDSVVADNLFVRNRGDGPHGYSSLWIDWAFQGSHITGNAFVDTDKVWIEAGHGPTLFANNVLVRTDLWCTDGGGLAAIHNAFIDCRDIRIRMLVPKVRSMQVYEPHTLNEIADIDGAIQDYLFANNLFIDTDFRLPTSGKMKGRPVQDNRSQHNVFLAGARPEGDHDEDSLRLSEGGAELQVAGPQPTVTMSLTIPDRALSFEVPVAASAFIGQRNRHVEQSLPAVLEGYFGHAFGDRPVAGPFADLQAGDQRLQLWPRP